MSLPKTLKNASLEILKIRSLLQTHTRALSGMATSFDAGASAHGCSGAVVRWTVDDLVVLLPPGDKRAPAQDC